MSVFTYDAATMANRDRVRLQIADTEEKAGPRPGGKNFTDDELDAILTAEGTWQRSVARCFEILAAAWAPKLSFTAQNGNYSRADASRVPVRYENLAASWRAQYGFGGDEDTADQLSFPTADDGEPVAPLFSRGQFGHTVANESGGDGDAWR